MKLLLLLLLASSRAAAHPARAHDHSRARRAARRPVDRDTSMTRVRCSIARAHRRRSTRRAPDSAPSTFVRLEPLVPGVYVPARARARRCSRHSEPEAMDRSLSALGSIPRRSFPGSPGTGAARAPQHPVERDGRGHRPHRLSPPRRRSSARASSPIAARTRRFRSIASWSASMTRPHSWGRSG